MQDSFQVPLWFLGFLLRFPSDSPDLSVAPFVTYCIHQLTEHLGLVCMYVVTSTRYTVQVNIGLRSELRDGRRGTLAHVMNTH